MKKVYILLFCFLSSSMFASLKEDYDSIKNGFGLSPFLYINNCSYSSIGGCVQGLTSGILMSRKYEEIVEYREGGAFLYWDETKGLKIEDYKKFCEFDSIDSKYIALKSISNNSSRSIGHSWEEVIQDSVTRTIYKLNQNGSYKTKLIKWKSKSKRLLQSDEANVFEAIRIQKIENPQFTIDGEYIPEKLEITLNPENPLENIQFFCNIIEVKPYQRENRAIRTPVKPWVKERILAEKEKIRRERENNFLNLEKLKQIDELNFQDFKNTKVSLKKDEWETCEEYLPKAIKFLEKTKRVGVARVGLLYDIEKEVLNFRIGGKSSTPQIKVGNKWFYEEEFWGRFSKTLTTSSVGNSKVVTVSLDNFRKESLPFPKDKAKRELENLEAFILFEYWENELKAKEKGGAVQDLEAGNVISYGIRNKLSNNWVYQEGSAFFSLRLKYKVDRGSCSLRDSYEEIRSLEFSDEIESNLKYFIEN